MIMGEVEFFLSVRINISLHKFLLFIDIFQLWHKLLHCTFLIVDTHINEPFYMPTIDFCTSVRWLHLRDSSNWNESTTLTTSSHSTEHAVITNSNSGLCTIRTIVLPTSCIRRERVSSFLLAFYLCSQSVMLADTHDLVRTSWNGSAARRTPKCLNARGWVRDVTKNFHFWVLHNSELQIIP